MKKEETKTIGNENGNAVKLVRPFNKKENPQGTPNAGEPEQGTPTAEPEQGTPKAEPEQVTPKVETFEELQKRLNAEIERLSEKTGLTKKRKTFVECLENLAKYAQNLSKEEGFETKVGKIVFQMFDDEANYNRGAYVDSISITTTPLILKFIQMLSNETKLQISELEAEILKP